MHRPYYTLSLFALSLSIAQATVVFDEGIDGEISDDFLNPSRINFSEGNNLVSGRLLGGGFDADFLSFTVPDGFVLTSIIPTTFIGGGNGSFLGIQASDILSAPPSNSFPDPIGHTLFNATAAANAVNILPAITAGPPFDSASSLSAGTYAAWLNEIDIPSAYTLDFVVTAVPEPSSSLLLSSALILLAQRRSRSKR